METFDYPARYTDGRGAEFTSIRNDGDNLRLSIRGYDFTGHDFDQLAPVEDIATIANEFRLNNGCRCSCCIECSIHVPLLDHDQQIDGLLQAEITLGDPNSHGGLNAERISLSLSYEGNTYNGSGNSGCWEDELLEIQAQLPTGVHFRTCIGGLYSDYSPYGHGSFGYMMCFRNIKAEYTRVKTKHDFWKVHDRYDRLVQETYWCNEFVKRIPGTGYRG